MGGKKVKSERVPEGKTGPGVTIQNWRHQERGEGVT